MAMLPIPGRCIRPLALVFGLVCSTAALAETEFHAIRTNKTDFSYYELGERVPARSAFASYVNPRRVVATGIIQPMELRPGEHMYCNTQVFGLGGSNQPTGPGVPNVGGNSEKNFFFPWVSNSCEKRTSNQPAAFCRGGDNKYHQGQDCRPPRPTTDRPTFFGVAVEDGTITDVSGSGHKVQLENERFVWIYRHMDEPNISNGQRVRQGTRLAKIWSNFQTTIHLHIELKVRGPNGLGHVDPLPSLIVAALRAQGIEPVIDQNGDLAFDSRFEIPAGDGCTAAQAQPSLGTENQFNFDSLWCHNGSIVGLVKDGQRRQFVYHKPKSETLRVAVRDEPVLFDGVSDDRSYKGDARYYSMRCGNRTFAVTGPISNGSHRVDVGGERDSFPDPTSCNPVRVPDDLSFTFIGPFLGTEPQGVAVSADTAQPAQKVGACAQAMLTPTLPRDQDVEIDSYWFHNCSIVGLVKGSSGQDSAARRFVYVRPKASLGTGPSRDAMLFDGAFRAQTYIGQALQYNSRCGDRRFDAIGPVDDDFQGVTVKGERPTFDDACQATGKTVECLRFTFAGRTLTDAVGQPLAQEACTVGTSASSASEPRQSVDAACRPFSICTFNYAALTPLAEPRDYRTKGFGYIVDWPGIIIDDAIRDSQQNPEGGGRGFVIPATPTRVAGSALWWFWMRKRANGQQGFDPNGTVTFKILATNFAGIDDVDHPKVQAYWRNYSVHSENYFGRIVSPDERLALSDRDVRWNLARTMFHHEAGLLFTAIDREIFDNSIGLAEAIIEKREINLEDFM